MDVLSTSSGFQMIHQEPFITGSALDLEIAARIGDVDRTLLRENLNLTFEQRLMQLIEQARLAEEFDRDYSTV